MLISNDSTLSKDSGSSSSSLSLVGAIAELLRVDCYCTRAAAADNEDGNKARTNQRAV